MIDYTFQNWHAKKASYWHIAPCMGDARDKVTLCDAQMVRGAQWSTQIKHPPRQQEGKKAPRFCPECIRVAPERGIRLPAEVTSNEMTAENE